MPHHRRASARPPFRQFRPLKEAHSRKPTRSMGGGGDAEVDVAVIGGGPGGLATALALIAKVWCVSE